MPRDGTVGIRNLRLPVLCVPEVRLELPTPTGLTRLDRYLLRVVQSEGRVALDDLAEATGVDAELLRLELRQLARDGVVAPAENGGFAVVPERCGRALETGQIDRPQEARYGVLMLPWSGDLIAFPQGRWQRMEADWRNRPLAAGSAPVPADMLGQPIRELLRDRLRSGEVAGVGKDASLVDHGGPETVPELCAIWLLDGVLDDADGRSEVDGDPAIRGRLARA